MEPAPTVSNYYGIVYPRPDIPPPESGAPEPGAPLPDFDRFAGKER